MRPSPKALVEDEIDMPPELLEKHRKLIACMDLMFVNGNPILTSIDKSIRYRKCVPLKNQTTPQLCSAIDDVLRDYNTPGYIVSESALMDNSKLS